MEVRLLIEPAMVDLIVARASQVELEEFQKKIGNFSRYCLKPFNYIDLLGHIRVALQKN